MEGHHHHTGKVPSYMMNSGTATWGRSRFDPDDTQSHVMVSVLSDILKALRHDYLSERLHNSASEDWAIFVTLTAVYQKHISDCHWCCSAVVSTLRCGPQYNYSEETHVRIMAAPFFLRCLASFLFFCSPVTITITLGSMPFSDALDDAEKQLASSKCRSK